MKNFKEHSMHEILEKYIGIFHENSLPKRIAFFKERLI